MALNKKWLIGETAVQKTNLYLSDPQKGMELVSTIISADSPKSREDRKKTYHQVDRLIDRQLLSSAGTLRLDRELELSARLMALSDRLSVPEKYHLLKCCTIIGVGGKFSSGKSTFLNSLIGSDANIQLPEEQTPSTAVPTYILHGPQEGAHAYTMKGSRLPLDEYAMEAVSHSFQREHGLGLAQYLSFLTVTSPNFAENIALLDTPGYNKPDSSMIESYSDESKAFSHLRSIDFLIWLMDVSNGTLQKDDISFIRRLGVTSKILVLVNKCDGKTQEEVNTVLRQAETDAKRAGLPVYDVVAYSSHKPSLFDGKERVEDFLRYAQKSDIRVEDVEKSLKSIIKSITDEFSRKISDLKKTRKELGTVVLKARDVSSLQGLVDQYGQISSEISELSESKKRFAKTADMIYKDLKQLQAIPAYMKNA